MKIKNLLVAIFTFGGMVFVSKKNPLQDKHQSNLLELEKLVSEIQESQGLKSTNSKEGIIRIPHKDRMILAEQEHGMK
jgi:hypothetical protein